jgi:tetratricopeptide (TPR) repeat protein
MKHAGLWAWSGLLCCATAAFVLSCLLSPLAATPGQDSGGFSVAGQLVGESRVALAEYLQEKADKDYHMGRSERHEVAFHDSFFQRVGNAISPTHHVHLSGAATGEMMPWIKMSLLSDPHNIESYLIASYWLAGPQINRPDKARETLLYGQTRNPRSHELQTELAILALRQGDTAEAKRFLDAGLTLWPGTRDPKTGAAILDKEQLLTYRALLYEDDGQIPQALAAWREILRILPDRTDVRERVQTLAAGKEPPVKASERWKAMLRKSDKDRGACQREPSPGETHPHDHAGEDPGSGQGEP